MTELITNLPPELQTLLLGAGSNLIAEWSGHLLNQAGTRVRKALEGDAHQAALQRAVGGAVIAAVELWPQAAGGYQDLWDKFQGWLLEPAVISEFRSLLVRRDNDQLDMDLLFDEFDAAGLTVAEMGQDDFQGLILEMIAAFYAAAADEELLQEPLKIGLLWEMAEGMGALTRLQERQNQLGHTLVIQMKRLNQMTENGVYGEEKQTVLLQEIRNLLQVGLDEQAAQRDVFYIVMNALSQSGAFQISRGHISVGNIDNSLVAIGPGASAELRRETESINRLLVEIRDNLAAPDQNLTPQALQAIARAYCQGIIDQFAKLTFRGIAPSARAISLPLDEIYVELKAVADIPEASDTYSADERRLLLEAGMEGRGEQDEVMAQLDTMRLERWRESARQERQARQFERRSIKAPSSTTSPSPKQERDSNNQPQPPAPSP